MRKRIHILFFLFAFSSLIIGQNRNVQYESYIKEYSNIAIEKMKEHGIPASITLAQGILESGAGRSRLATEANNHFGIKCHSDWKGATIHHDDDALQECFRKYSHAKQSYEDHSLFLTTRGRYSFLFDLNKTDYKAWAYGLKKAGYATDPKYPERLIKLIEDYELYAYDLPASKQKKKHIAINKETSDSKTEEKITIEAVTDEKGTRIFYSDNMIGQITPFTTHEVKKINGVRYVVAKENDSYENIADEFGLKAKELYTINDANQNDDLEAGEIVFIRKKKARSSSVTFHVVKPDETMREIAQKYGIRLKTLYKRNDMREGVRPMIGQRLNLK